MAMEAADRDQALATKIICLVLFGVISLGCGLLPLIASRVARCWRRSRTGKTEVRVSGRVRVMLSCVLCLGGGVLLGTVFTHMLPEVREIFLKIEGADLLPGMHPPAGEIFICAGFFLVYMVEELVHAFLAGRASAKKKRHVAPAPAVSSPSSSVVVEVHGDRDAMSWHEKYAEPASSPVVAMSPVTTADLSEPDHAGHDHGSVVATLHALRAYIVIVALSVHSVFEGFAVAFEATSRDVWILFAAIATHKAIVAFCLGEQLLATKRSACFVVTNLVILSAASPLGVTIGLAVEQLDQDEGSRLLATGLLQALAAGTILYVVFFEILAPERQKHGAGLLKFLAVVAGFSLIVLMHSSGGGHSHGGPAHELPPGVHVHNAGEVDTHSHDHAHSAAETVNSDYLARVPNESGHVYNTVRYIKSFSRQEPPTVDTVDIVAGMRSIVEDLGGSAHEHDHDHAHEHAHGEDPHGEDGHGDEKSADPIPASSEKSADSGGKQVRPQNRDGDHPDDHADHIGHDDHAHHEDHDHDPHDERDGHGPSAPGASGESRSASGEEEEGTHHHDHDQFMRTVADLAGRLGGLDRRAVDRTVTLIDTLDLIAMQKTDRKAKSRGKATAKPSAGKNSHNHDQDHDHDHEHEHGDSHGSAGDIPSSPSLAPEAPSPSAPGAADPSGPGPVERQWLHAAHFGEPFDSHVQFVLQEPGPEASQARDVSPAPAPTQTAGPSSSTGAPSSTSTSTGVPSAGETTRELDAAMALEEVEEVRFHDQSSDGDREHVHGTTHAPP